MPHPKCRIIQGFATFERQQDNENVRKFLKAILLDHFVTFMMWYNSRNLWDLFEITDKKTQSLYIDFDKG